jgi:hypothetical protein
MVGHRFSSTLPPAGAAEPVRKITRYRIDASDADESLKTVLKSDLGIKHGFV